MGLSSHMGCLELSVMNRLWASDDWATVREVHEALTEDREVAYTTIMTVMGRLAKKSLADQQRDGRAYRYRAAASRETMTAELMWAAVDEFASADRRTALVAFVEDATDAERVALRAALARLEVGGG